MAPASPPPLPASGMTRASSAKQPERQGRRTAREQAAASGAEGGRAHHPHPPPSPWPGSPKPPWNRAVLLRCPACRWPRPRRSPRPRSAGGVRFRHRLRHTDLCAELRARRYLVASVAAPERGRLRRAIDDAIEGALATRGALPPAVELDAPLEPTLRDQVFRARALGATGLALTLPRLADTAGGVLDADDSATLSTWLAASRRAPLLLVLDERNRGARVLTPVPIADLAGPSPLAAPDTTPPPSGEIETGAFTATEPPPMPPPPVLNMPRRGVMKKRSLRAERPDAPAPEAVEPPIAENDDAPPKAPPAPRANPVALARAAAALMAPRGPARAGHPAAARRRRGPLRGARSPASAPPGARPGGPPRRGRRRVAAGHTGCSTRPAGPSQ